ncbi:endonuclease domain-containing 1 protein-like isoform X1 [Anguilla anguilla]|uniref:endonuclease domain-containing 1 protein-like isoform X1 n=1 Tax=Anguilla anguilla TaxID=7936 RepID=UPI0015AEA9F6|nr:endonuclease domain-containing 1 protein-like isoform X1 [Anguilla anguilla]
MQVLAALCFLVLAHLPPLRGEVVESFQDVPECLDFFYERMVPKLDAANPNATRLCQRFNNSYHFATLYNTNNRIAVYSAYRFQTGGGGGRGHEKCWYIEPQLVNTSLNAEMEKEQHFRKEHKEPYIGERQALNEDYTMLDYDRGHLNPNGHHTGNSRNATFTLTNVVPQNHDMNQNAWSKYEQQLTKLFNAQCAQAYVLVGAIPSKNTWIVKKNKPRINIPDYIWNAYCCLDNNGRPIGSGGATVRNTGGTYVERCTLWELKEFLSQYQSPVGELFLNNCGA